MRHPHRALAARCAGPRRQRGISLLEMLVALAIVGILMAVAMPSFQGTLLNSRLTSVANELVATSMLARSTAITHNAPVTMCQSANGSSCGGGTGWESGYVVLCTSNDGIRCTNTPSADAVTLVLATQAAAATGWKISEASGLTTLVFQSTGTEATAASLTVCRQSPTAGPHERVVRVSPTGRASVAKTSAGVCS